MKKYDLLRNDETVIRVLEIQSDRVLVIDCTKRRMPVWIEHGTLDSFSSCSIEELGIDFSDKDSLDADQKKTMYDRYTMIAPILPFIVDEKVRSKVICSVAEEHGVSKQTVRNYLCLYLTYMDIAALAPKKRIESEELTQDEKNIRWALNKFFYTTAKQSLHTAYTLMLKEKYCDGLSSPRRSKKLRIGSRKCWESTKSAPQRIGSSLGRALPRSGLITKL